MARRRRRRHEDEMELNLIPMIDVMLKEAKQAPQLTQEAMAQARAGQEAALQAQAEAQAAVARMQAAQARAANAQNDDEKASAKSEADDALQASESAQAAASLAQKTVAAAQVKITQQVNIFGDAATEASHAAQDAAAAQAAAEQQQDIATTSRANFPRAQQAVDQAATEVRRARKADDDAKQRLDAMGKHLAELQTPTSPTLGLPAAAAEPLIVASTPAAGTSAASPAPAASPAAPIPIPVPTPSKKVRDEIDRLTKALPQAASNEAKLAAHVADSEQKLTARQTQAATELSKLQADEDQARQKQQLALESQAKAEQQIAAALAKPGLVSPTAEASFSPPPAAPGGDADLARLFNQARQMETAVTESYKNVRAVELAAVRQIPLSQAMSLTEVAKPVRGEIDTSILTRDIRDVQGVREQEKTIQAASAQMSSMVALAERMKELAQPTTQAAVSVDAMKATAAQSERMEQLAAEDEGTKAKDLSAAMQGANSSADSGGHGHGDRDAAIARATAATAAAAARFAAHPLDPKAALEYRQALDALNTLEALARAGGVGAGAGNQSGYTGGVPDVPYLNAQKFKPIPGRTITHAMVAAPPGRELTWMFVDSWYIIGPWPNPQRKNLNTKFPPESVVDLDATYVGGRRDEAPLPVRWRFHQDSAVRKNAWNDENTGLIVPPGLGEFEIYYSYTELWLDQAADLWVAIGSDDQSKIWLNDQMIWKSADYYKGWVPNEGLRKVHFGKGINRLLYRLENGQLRGGFSFMVCLNPNATPPPEVSRQGR